MRLVDSYVYVHWMRDDTGSSANQGSGKRLHGRYSPLPRLGAEGQVTHAVRCCLPQPTGRGSLWVGLKQVAMFVGAP